MTYREGYNIEIKREYTSNIIKTVIAFANTKWRQDIYWHRG